MSIKTVRMGAGCRINPARDNGETAIGKNVPEPKVVPEKVVAAFRKMFSGSDLPKEK